MRRTDRIGTAGALVLLLTFAGAQTARAVDGRVPTERETSAGRDEMASTDLVSPPGSMDIFDAMRPDAVLEVRESAFNEAAAALEPVTLKGRKNWTVPDWVPLAGGKAICDPDYTVDVTGITLGISPDGVSVKANVRARWCGQAFTADVDTTGDIAYDPAQRHFLVTIDPTSVRPSIVITIDVYLDEYKFDVPLPVTIDLAGIAAPPIPVRSFFFTYETSKGSGTMHGLPRDVVLIKRQGYIELQSDLRLW